MRLPTIPAIGPAASISKPPKPLFNGLSEECRSSVSLNRFSNEVMEYEGVSTGTVATAPSSSRLEEDCVPSGHRSLNARPVELALWRKLKSERDMAGFSAAMIYRIFDMPEPPKHIVFVAYLSKVCKITRIAHPVIFLALKYMSRLRTLFGGKCEKPVAITGLFTSTLILANHVLDDNAYTNKTWAQVTSIHPTIINTTQRQLMQILNHRLHVDVFEYDQFLDQLASHWIVHTKSRSIHAHDMPTEVNEADRTSHESAHWKSIGSLCPVCSAPLMLSKQSSQIRCQCAGDTATLCNASKSTIQNSRPFAMGIIQPILGFHKVSRSSSIHEITTAARAAGSADTLLREPRTKL